MVVAVSGKKKKKFTYGLTKVAVTDSCTQKKKKILKYPATVPGKELEITNFHSQWGL